MSVGVVIPTYNRQEGLKLTLEALQRQTFRDFTVVIADDGSTDGTGETIKEMIISPQWSGRLSWVGCGPNIGVRTGRARNIGAANLPRDCDLMVMLDTEVILHPKAIEFFFDVHKQYPDAVIIGRMDWLPPMDIGQVVEVLRTKGIEALRTLVPDGRPERVDGTFVGEELRTTVRPGLFERQSGVLQPIKSEWALPSTAGYPLHLFWDIGGFDEAMIGYGFQDIEFGVRAERKGIQCLLFPQIWSLHAWHAKQDPLARLTENQANLDYVIRKHGSNNVLDGEIQWGYWAHYQKERGGRVRSLGDTFWAFNSVGNRRLRLPSATWIERLGFCLNCDVESVSIEELNLAQDVGIAAERLT